VGTPLALSATASSGLAIAFTSATPNICTVDGATVTFLASGTCTIDANQAGDSTYAAAEVQESFTVSANFTLSAGSGSGGTGSGGTGSGGAGSGGTGCSGSGPTQTVEPGGTAVYTINIAPTAGTTFPVSTLLTVTGLPAGATAALPTPTTWAQLTSTSWHLPANTPLSAVTLSFQLPSQTARLHDRAPTDRRLPPILWGVLLLPFIARLRRAGMQLRRNAAWLILLILGAASLAGLSGCVSANGFFGQPQQTYTVTITVTTGAVSHSANVTLNVE
jgi:hypothetical protein